MVPNATRITADAQRGISGGMLVARTTADKLKVATTKLTKACDDPEGTCLAIAHPARQNDRRDRQNTGRQDCKQPRNERETDKHLHEMEAPPGGTSIVARRAQSPSRLHDLLENGL